MTYLTIGQNLEQPGEQVRLHQPSLLEGCYMLGNTGMGKTTLITSMVLQNVENGIGVCIVEPHGDFIDELLIALHKHLDDVYLLELTNTDLPFGLNLLELSGTSAIDIDKTVDRAMDIFLKVYGIARDNPHMYEYLMNACYTLLTQPGYTLTDIPMLFTNKQFRQSFYASISDAELLYFWQTYDSMKPIDQQEA